MEKLLGSIALSQPKGFISIKHATVEDSKHTKQLAIETSVRTYMCYAESIAIQEQWLEAITIISEFHSTKASFLTDFGNNSKQKLRVNYYFSRSTYTNS